MASFAAIDVYDFDSVQQEAQYRGLIEELRCPKCQNQNLAGSDAPIAQDLKQKTYDLIKDGRSDGEIRAYMQERYGDFISYKPPVRPSTWILWFFPPLLLIVLLVGWFWHSKRRQLVASGESGVAVDNHVKALSAAEKAELDRLLSRANNDDKDDTTSLGGKK
ncbi:MULTISPECIES: cytochrome c-type biogenesis protein [unclassified Psychrobacter]|uniref:cytochrome c-type biogenesis protein n=1 Tax=unclassified Psychrobacter TaxID=196806 RepID=UPI003FD036E8